MLLLHTRTSAAWQRKRTAEGFTPTQPCSEKAKSCKGLPVEGDCSCTSGHQLHGKEGTQQKGSLQHSLVGRKRSPAKGCQLKEIAPALQDISCMAKKAHSRRVHSNTALLGESEVLQTVASWRRMRLHSKTSAAWQRKRTAEGFSTMQPCWEKAKCCKGLPVRRRLLLHSRTSAA